MLVSWMSLTGIDSVYSMHLGHDIDITGQYEAWTFKDHRPVISFTFQLLEDTADT